MEINYISSAKSAKLLIPFFFSRNWLFDANRNYVYLCPSTKKMLLLLKSFFEILKYYLSTFTLLSLLSGIARYNILLLKILFHLHINEFKAVFLNLYTVTAHYHTSKFLNAPLISTFQRRALFWGTLWKNRFLAITR